MRRGRFVAAALVASSFLIPATASADGVTPATTSLRQTATVDWSGGDSVGRDRTSFSIPGIGSGELICRQNAALIRMRPTNRQAETSMWSVIEQGKVAGDSFAIHNARTYTFSTPTSTVAHGTGPLAHEGLNQKTPMEDAGSGSAFGLFSQRTGRNVPAVPTAAPTSFALDWKWSGFRTGGTAPKCHASVTLTTQLPATAKVRSRQIRGLSITPGPAANGLTLDWHGEADAATKFQSAVIDLPYIGQLQATCPTGADSTVFLTANAYEVGEGISIDADTYEGEGVDAYWPSEFFSDPGNGSSGPIPLPENGMIRATVSSGTRSTQIVVSSIRKLNDPRPAENFCEIAAQAISG